MHRYLLLISILHSRLPSFSCMRCSFGGGFRCLADTLPPGSPLATHRISCLGNPYGIAPLAVSIDPAGRLARTPCRNRAVPERVPAPLSGQARLSHYLRQRAHYNGGDCLPLKFGVLWSTNVDQPARSSLTGLSLYSRGQSHAAKVLLGEHDFVNAIGLARC